MCREVIFYRTVTGGCPVEDFLDSLPAKAAQKVTWTLKLLEELERLPSTYFKKLVNTDDIWECRIQFASNIYRIFCFFDNGSIVVLTHGVVKKSQKTPPGEIGKAERYKKDYLNRRKS